MSIFGRLPAFNKANHEMHVRLRHVAVLVVFLARATHTPNQATPPKPAPTAADAVQTRLATLYPPPPPPATH